MISNAVGSERISRIVGYILTAGDFSEVSPNLPQRIAILAEANNANQSDLDLNPKQITSAQQAGELYGYGSPAFTIMRVLRARSGDVTGGIPTFVYPQAEAAGAAARVVEVTAVGVATGNGTHRLVIAGRDNVDGVPYDINVESGDTAADIHDKIADAVNRVLGSPMSAVNTDYEATLTTKWKGLTAQGVGVRVDTGESDLGLTYTVTQTTAGSGTPSVQAALDLFGNVWNTIVINAYGTVTAVMDALQNFNGIPLATNPTGRYQGIVMKPFIAITGSVAADPSAITDARKNEVTIAIAPAPNSEGLPMEAAANMCVLFARLEQDAPHLDVGGLSYPDMPVPSNGNIGVMANYNDRDTIVKKGCSTVDLVAGVYQVQDFVTTYHKDGELPPQYRYCRNLMVDFNIRFGYYLLEQTYVVGKALAADGDDVEVDGVLKPKDWRQLVFSYADSLSTRALIAQPEFMQASIRVGISTTNPDRLETFFKYKRTGTARISSTTAEAGFNFGTV